MHGEGTGKNMVSDCWLKKDNVRLGWTGRKKSKIVMYDYFLNSKGSLISNDFDLNQNKINELFI